MRDKLGRKLGKREQMRANWGPKYARLRAGEDSACTRLTISCAGIVNDCRSVLSVPKTVQSKLNRDEILHIFIAHGEQHAIPSQLIVIFVHNLKRLEASLFAQVDVSVAPLLLQAKDIGGISTRGREGAERSRRPCAADKAARAQARPIGRTRALASARRIWGLESIGLAAWRLCKVHAITSNR